jgi:hypothetical protein
MHALLLATTLLGQSPQTVPERSHFERTSTVAEVQAFMDGLGKAHPELAPWRPMGGPKATESGAPLLAWHLDATTPDPLRVYLNGNIHAGEVEGKEALQELARELVEGQHPELRRLEFVFMPCYNAEGTDALDPANRRHQPNPASGVGRRETDRGLDLNRDAMKAEAPSTRWYLAMLRSFDPHAVFDLHTTNGSFHGFHLTYAPALTLGGDAALLAFNRRMLNDVRDRLAQEGLPTYDYGNFEPSAAPERWESYDPFPRYLVNHAGLTGRLGILSEAYVYRTFPERIADTKRFLLGCLRWLAAHADDVKRATASAQATRPERLPLAAKPALTERRAFEVVDPLKDEHGKLIGEKVRRRVELPSFVSFEPVPDSVVDLPAGYLVHPAFAAEVKALLEAQGLRTAPGTARPRLPVRHFQETGRTLASRPFQGIFTLDLQGRWSDAPTKASPAWTPAQLDGALWVGLDQPLGRLAFYLLDPRSPDGLIHWGRFHSLLLRGGWGEAPAFPILVVGGKVEAADPSSGGTPQAKKPE